MSQYISIKSNLKNYVLKFLEMKKNQYSSNILHVLYD